MDAAFGKQLDSNLSILPLKTKKALIFLSKQAWIGKSDWYLAGGTALALQAGHRKSVDLDFFTTKSKFNSKTVLGNFVNNNNWRTSFEEENTIYGELFKAKISFIAYPFFIPKQDFIRYGFVKILHPLDIAVMKIIAVSQRGRKRDFFDLYWCAKNIEPMENSIKRLKVQYPTVAHDYHHILKSLVYFNDAESDPAPEIYFKASWKDVKDYFKKEILNITNKMIIKK
ncbi:MAG: nucleotidyl transferase AbiEii/AbiGii toxin family protein [Patescibacteria group bacterium]